MKNKKKEKIQEEINNADLKSKKSAWYILTDSLYGRLFYKRKIYFLIVLIIINLLSFFIGSGFLTIGDIFDHYSNQNMIFLFIYIILAITWLILFLAKKLSLKISIIASINIPLIIFMLIFAIERRQAQKISKQSISYVKKAVIVGYSEGSLITIDIKFRDVEKEIHRRLKTTKGFNIPNFKRNSLIGDTIIISHPIYSTERSFIVVKNTSPSDKVKLKVERFPICFNGKCYRKFKKIPLNLRRNNYNYIYKPLIKNIDFHWYF